MKILVTGSQGFIPGYIVEEFLEGGHSVVGIDNYSKYGFVEKNYDKHPNFTLVKGDVKDTNLLKELVEDCDQVVAAAAMVGGITYNHQYPFDILIENEEITTSTFNAALWAFRNKHLKKINIISSSMVFENSHTDLTKEGDQLLCPPALLTYGFQKLASEYFAISAFNQHKLPYTIIRACNCIGIGEQKTLCEGEVPSGSVNIGMIHVIPDLVQKILRGQDPLHILGDGNQVRQYTYGGDFAKGVLLCIESEKSINEDFNISTERETTVKELATLIWKKIKGDKPIRFVHDKSVEYDVQRRVLSVEKAKRVLGFEATTEIDTVLDEIIPWVENQIKLGNI